jgi:hypothetical protein
MTSASSLKVLRLTHNYIGVFFAPTILFFAITGALQMFGLHGTSRGSSYAPPAILVHLSQLHKKGTLYLPPRKAAPSTSAKTDRPKPDTPKSDLPKFPTPAPARHAPNPLPMKVFFGATALALVISTCTGLLMSRKYARRKPWWEGFSWREYLVPCFCCFYEREIPGRTIDFSQDSSGKYENEDAVA